MKLTSFSLACGLAVCLGDQTPVPVAKEPNHHLKLENPYIRIYDVVVPPGQATLMHVHEKDYFFVDFGGATLENEAAGQPEQDLILKDGEVRYSAATVTHRVRNVAKIPFHNLTVELLQPQSTSPQSFPPPGKDQTIILQNKRIRAIQTLLQPGESTGLHSHPRPMLAIMVSNGSVRIEVPGRKSDQKRVKSGDFMWHDAQLTHSLSNSGKTPVQIIEVELK